MCEACENALKSFKPESIKAMRDTKGEFLTQAVTLRDKNAPLDGLPATILELMPQEVRKHATEFSAILFAIRSLGYLAAEMAKMDEEIHRAEQSLQSGLVAGWASKCISEDANEATKH